MCLCFDPQLKLLLCSTYLNHFPSFIMNSHLAQAITTEHATLDNDASLALNVEGAFSCLFPPYHPFFFVASHMFSMNHCTCGRVG